MQFSSLKKIICLLILLCVYSNVVISAESYNESLAQEFWSLAAACYDYTF